MGTPVICCAASGSPGCWWTIMGTGRLALWVKAPPGEQDALVSSDARRYFVPPYLGPRGWVGVNLDDASRPDWAEVGGLLEQAWRMTATKTAVSAYDATRARPG